MSLPTALVVSLLPRWEPSAQLTAILVCPSLVTSRTPPRMPSGHLKTVPIPTSGLSVMLPITAVPTPCTSPTIMVSRATTLSRRPRWIGPMSTSCSTLLATMATHLTGNVTVKLRSTIYVSPSYQLQSRSPQPLRSPRATAHQPCPLAGYLSTVAASSTCRAAGRTEPMWLRSHQPVSITWSSASAAMLRWVPCRHLLLTMCSSCAVPALDPRTSPSAI